MDTIKKLIKILFRIKIVVGNNIVRIPAKVLEGLHFDVLLGVSQIKEASAVVNATEGVMNVDGKKIKLKPYPEKALFVAEEGGRVYRLELNMLHTGKVWVCRSSIKQQLEMKNFSYRDKF